MDFYNENDKNAAYWLRNLMAAGAIPNGQIETKSITEIMAAELAGYRQCHFFAGIAGWPLALKLGGWPIEREVWTGSCPCQPFSCAGKRRGVEDERHLWPEFRRLIAQCKPATIFGEQVASREGREWLAGVRFDLNYIIFWSQFYKSLHEVREKSKSGRLPQVLGEIIGRVASAVPGLPEKIRTLLEAKASDGEAQDEGTEEGSGQSISEELYREEQGLLFGVAHSGQVSQERDTFRPQFPSPGNQRAHTAGGVRSKRSSAPKGPRTDELRQPVDRQDKSEGWVSLREHKDCLLGDQLGLGVLGRGCIAARDGCVAGTEIADDDRRLSEAFGKYLNTAFGCVLLSGVRSDLEAMGYAVGAADLCAAGVGAPHIRQRLFWVADRDRERWQGGAAAHQRRQFIGVGHNLGDTSRRRRSGHDRRRTGKIPAEVFKIGGVWGRESVVGADGKARRIEPGISPLAHGVSGRVAALRAYGNAIVPQVAAEFIGAFLDAENEMDLLSEL